MKYSSKTIIVFLCFFSAYGAKKSSVLKDTTNTEQDTARGKLINAGIWTIGIGQIPAAAIIPAPTALLPGVVGATAAAAVIGGVGAGIARGAMARNCKKLCSAYFTQEARDNNQTGTVYYNHVGAKVKGTIFKNRICKCTYGNKKAKFNHRDKRGPLGKIYKAMCKAGRDGKCNVQTTTCLINAPRACVYALADK